MEVGEEFFGDVVYVVMAIPRPSGKVLLMRKSMYPAGVYRLPSGKVHEGESPEDALLREGYEETGYDLGDSELLETIVTRLRHDTKTLTWVSHVYLCPEQSEEPQVKDPNEKIDGFREIPFCELSKIADQLESLPPGHWRDWGRFRAVEHRVAYNKLCRNSA